jgi:ferric-dicitrate binding protein FerR (iron transport regulator)
MKEMMKTERFTDREWEEIASALSGEKECQPELMKRFMDDDDHDVEKTWKGLKTMSDEKGISVDDAWNKVKSRIETKWAAEVREPARLFLMRSTFMRVAAVALLLLGIGAATLYFVSSDSLSRKIVVATDNSQVNFRVSLPDGSSIFMNRNSELTYHSNFGRHSRNVALSGEAFFEIAANTAKPFIIDAGKTSVKVVGTSFNVITNNADSALEVFVRTGKVMLSDNAGTRNLLLEPGFVGTMNAKLSERRLNDNPNYLAWQTRSLVYNGQTLDVVFRDLKRVYNMDIIADDRSILNEALTTSSIDNLSQETVIRLICATFNLDYTKDGDIYHLSKK